MEHKILSQDCIDDVCDFVQTCVCKPGFEVSKDSDFCPINKYDFSCVDDFPLAMAYIPMQKFENLYSLDEALCAGTLYKDLDKPFLGGNAERKGWFK